MNIFRCELCEKPCTLTTLGNVPAVYCPVTGKMAEWRQVNGRASEKMPQATGAGKEVPVLKPTFGRI